MTASRYYLTARDERPSERRQRELRERIAWAERFRLEWCERRRAEKEAEENDEAA